MQIQKLSNEQLILETHGSVKVEREATALVIRYFQEIYDRKLYLQRGFPSFFEMVTKEFGYCPASAQRRINAMKLIRDVPAVEEKIESGEMTLTVAANIQQFLNEERKLKKSYSQSEKIELVETCIGKSVREVERELAKRNPEIETKRDSVHFVTGDRVRVSYSSSVKLEENLQRLKELLSHKNPNMTREELLLEVSDIALEKLDPARKLARAEKRETRKESLLPPPEAKLPLKITRYIPSQAKRLVIKANANRGCEHVDHQTKRRCGSSFLLQIDHIRPWAMGGDHSAENLRLLCANHNRARHSAFGASGSV